MSSAFCRIVIFFLFLFQFSVSVFSRQSFRFAIFSDLHIEVGKKQPAEELQSAVHDLNSLNDIDFVIVTGDITQNGDSLSFIEAQNILLKLKVPYYAIGGNHDFKWNTTEQINFVKIFGSDRFSFVHKQYQFIAISTTKILNAKKASFTENGIKWLTEELKRNKKYPVVLITHHPLKADDVENFTQLTGLLLKKSVVAVLSGHYHRNLLLNYDGIPGIVNRSMQRASDSVGGYSVYTFSDTLTVKEKKIGQLENTWLRMPLNVK